MPFLGAHMSIAGGIELAPERGGAIGCEIIQLFTKANHNWAAKPLTDRECEAFKKNMDQYRIRIAFAHDSYLINLGSPDKTLHKKSLEAFIDEHERAERLGLLALVFHPGSHVGSGSDAAIKRIAESVNNTHQKTEGFKVFTCYENAAGQGTNVGHRFEHLAQLLELTEDKKRTGICFDTQHAFASGYDLRTKEGYKKVLDEFDKVVGVDRIKCFHLNDSKKELGSRVDRHEQIGKGHIGLEGFRCLMNDPRFKNHPMSLETPKGPDLKEDVRNLAILRSLLT
ncbi:MAG: deoxyribonuclease IV [Deltaproteobacteria bacterium]|nr:deoxyribonuclease IV [Deltaproteobacteria bacterium]